MNESFSPFSFAVRPKPLLRPADMELCRACMQENSSKEMISLVENITTIVIYKNCTSIEIDVGDQQLPSLLCTICYTQLIEFNRFRTTCIDSENRFRQNIAIKLEKENEETDEKQILFVLEQHSTEADKVEKVFEDYKNEDDMPNDNFELSKEDCSDNELNDLKNDETSQDKDHNNYSSKLYCDMCDKIFVKKRCIAAHLRRHVGLMPYSCEKCDAEFIHWNTLNQHYKMKHTEMDKYICTVDTCSQSFADRAALIVHRLEIHSIASNKLVCDLCGKTFLKKHVLESHQRIHQGLKQYKCTECDKAFKRCSYRTLHFRQKHTSDPKKFICKYENCNKIFKSNGACIYHTKLVHTKDMKLLVCEMCGKTFISKFALKEHFNIHTGAFPYSCNICPRMFRSKSSLYLHVSRHQGINKCFCTVCGAEKATKIELKIHMNVHTREKTYPCTICSTVYNSKNSLWSHTAYVHKGKQKTYVCKFCNTRFKTPSSLKDHVMRHTGEKPHACKICEKRFIQSSALRTHMKVHMKKDLA